MGVRADACSESDLRPISGNMRAEQLKCLTKTKPRCPARLITAPGIPDFFIRDSKALVGQMVLVGPRSDERMEKKILLVKK